MATNKHINVIVWALRSEVGVGGGAGTRQLVLVCDCGESVISDGGDLEEPR